MSTGFNFEAFIAGSVPANAPIKKENRKTNPRKRQQNIIITRPIVEQNNQIEEQDKKIKEMLKILQAIQLEKELKVQTN